MSHKLKIKQVDLSGVQQDNTKSRFLVIDSNGNISWNDSPVSEGSITYTNPNPIETQIGGIPVGQTFLNNTMQEMWDMLLYPYLIPTFTSFTVSGPAYLEVGESLPANLSFTWESDRDSNVQPGSIEIYDAVDTLISGQNSDSANSLITSHTYGVPVRLTEYGSYTWTIQGENTQSLQYTETASKAWWWSLYWGESSSSEYPTEEFIKDLANIQVRQNKNGSFWFPPTGYKYLAIPAVYGVPSTIYYQGLPVALADSDDGYYLGIGNMTYTQISITNSYGATTLYNVFRSKHPLVDAITLVVS